MSTKQSMSSFVSGVALIAISAGCTLAASTEAVGPDARAEFAVGPVAVVLLTMGMGMIGKRRRREEHYSVPLPMNVVNDHDL